MLKCRREWQIAYTHDFELVAAESRLMELMPQGKAMLKDNTVPKARPPSPQA
jgi:hypothetical protein